MRRSSASSDGWPASRSRSVGLDRIAEVARGYNFDAVDDFYAAIGYGAIGAQPVVMRLGVVDDDQLALPTVAPPPSSPRTGGVRVKGVGDLLVRFAKCCHPIPGDPIVGFITRGKGVTVHLQTCPTVVNEREVDPAHRGRVGGRADADLPDRDPGRGVRPDRACSTTSRRWWRRAKVNIVAAAVSVNPDHTAVVAGDAPGRVGLAARPGHGPDRAAQGRHHGPARPGLTSFVGSYSFRLAAAGSPDIKVESSMVRGVPCRSTAVRCRGA